MAQSLSANTSFGTVGRRSLFCPLSLAGALHEVADGSEEGVAVLRLRHVHRLHHVHHLKEVGFMICMIPLSNKTCLKHLLLSLPFVGEINSAFDYATPGLARCACPRRPGAFS